MRKIFLRDSRNCKIYPELVRYFKYQNDYYLIYTFREIDENNFMKLYIVGVLEELGIPIAKYLKADWEWQQVQVVIKQILKELKQNKKMSFQDIEIETLEGMKISEARSFKLLAPLVEILSGNCIPKEEMSTEKTFSEENTKVKDSSVMSRIQRKSIESQSKINNSFSPSKIEESVDSNIYNIQPIESVNKTTINPLEDIRPIDVQIQNDITKDERYLKLQKENEELKKQVLNYKIQYQTLKDLLTATNQD